MKKVIAFFTLSASVLFSFEVQAASSAGLQVTGTIRPTSCDAVFNNGGVVDYGVIKAHLGVVNTLEEKTIPLIVNCGGPVRFALRVVDNQVNSVVPGLIAKHIRDDLDDGSAYGLGTIDGKGVGAYAVRINNLLGTKSAGTQPVRLQLLSGHPGTSWVFGGGTRYSFFSSDGLGAWKGFALGNTPPEAWMSWTGDLVVSAVINQMDDLTEEIGLTGSATLEVMYL